MYLDFIHDIVKCGDSIVISCNDCTIEGIVVKINNNLIAVKQSNGSIILKEDNDIINIKVVNKDNQPSKDKNVTDLPQGKERCGMILIKKDKSESFRCLICGKDKISKKYAIEKDNPNIRICNSCYGWTLARLENK